MTYKKSIAVIVSGYFNPIHKGHIDYFKQAKALGHQLFVIVNNDYQRELKGSKAFQDEEERLLIVSNIKSVNKAILSIDQDSTVRATLKKIVNEYKSDFDFMFANGGDQNNKSIPEAIICEELGVLLTDGLGEKIQSSSWLLKK
ncbi:cytidyltransferase [Nonlabens sp. MB-3u-79]|uniref:adenylyltransferase/cytidyltransferase family protein n=1 Tax=Nonlabens sp. MB-3u-79 TaxID=2058134 RepID=UPI000C318144|nr:adenylyltransferase/cytidyltransferase family protein [Nonlabens sp. MB-3u-79]AUC79531.1 cytidyltransferase [Nonlabens sp. MB-3u-79]